MCIECVECEREEKVGERMGRVRGGEWSGGGSGWWLLFRWKVKSGGKRGEAGGGGRKWGEAGGSGRKREEVGGSGRK